MARLAEFLAARAARYVLLFGALTDKETGEMLPPLLARAHAAVLTEPASPRARPAADLARTLPPGLPARVVEASTPVDSDEHPPLAAGRGRCHRAVA